MTTSTITPTTIDLAPLVASQPESAAMLARLRAGEDVSEGEFQQLYRRIDTETARVLTALRALVSSPEAAELWSAVSDDVGMALDLISGQHLTAVEWDERR